MCVVGFCLVLMLLSVDIIFSSPVLGCSSLSLGQIYLFHTFCLITVNGKGYFLDNMEFLAFIQKGYQYF